MHFSKNKKKVSPPPFERHRDKIFSFYRIDTIFPSTTTLNGPVFSGKKRKLFLSQCLTFTPPLLRDSPPRVSV